MGCSQAAAGTPFAVACHFTGDTGWVGGVCRGMNQHGLFGRFEDVGNRTFETLMISIPAGHAAVAPAK